MAAYRSENEKARDLVLPELEWLEAGKPIGTVLPLTEQARRLLLDRIETVDVLLHEDDVTWN